MVSPFHGLISSDHFFISVQAEEGKLNGKTVGDQLDVISDFPVRGLL